MLPKNIYQLPRV